MSDIDACADDNESYDAADEGPVKVDPLVERALRDEAQRRWDEAVNRLG